MVQLNSRFRLVMAPTQVGVVGSLSRKQTSRTFLIVDTTGKLSNETVFGFGNNDPERLEDAQYEALKRLIARGLHPAS